MGGTKAGGKLAARNNKSRYGEDFYIKIGAIGGRTSRRGGFAGMPKWKVRAAGRKGGSISKRRPTV